MSLWKMRHSLSVKCDKPVESVVGGDLQMSCRDVHPHRGKRDVVRFDSIAASFVAYELLCGKRRDPTTTNRS
jgi:hypothetical protein